MKKLYDGIILYHGSYCEVRQPDLKKCAAYKDFGKGFYVTSSKRQAENFISTSLKKAKSQGVITEDQPYGVISSFEFEDSDELMKYAFSDSDAEWLHCVVGHRKKGTFPAMIKDMERYDIISGKIADDATNFTIVAYLAGTYGTIGSKDADDLCVSRLLPDRLKDQYCFRTDLALKHLRFIGSERIWKS